MPPCPLLGQPKLRPTRWNRYHLCLQVHDSGPAGLPRSPKLRWERMSAARGGGCRVPPDGHHTARPPGGSPSPIVIAMLWEPWSQVPARGFVAARMAALLGEFGGGWETIDGLCREHWSDLAAFDVERWESEGSIPYAHSNAIKSPRGCVLPFRTGPAKATPIPRFLRAIMPVASLVRRDGLLAQLRKRPICLTLSEEATTPLSGVWATSAAASTLNTLVTAGLEVQFRASSPLPSSRGERHRRHGLKRCVAVARALLNRTIAVGADWPVWAEPALRKLRRMPLLECRPARQPGFPPARRGWR